jgi:hypothetical protein
MGSNSLGACNAPLQKEFRQYFPSNARNAPAIYFMAYSAYNWIGFCQDKE